MKRRPLIVLLCAALLAVVAAVMLWSAGDSVPRFGQTIASGTAKVGGPFSLVDQNGRTRTDAEFRGRSMLVYFGYTNCPDVCPTTLNVIGDALKKLGAQSPRIAALFVTLDPERDTPALLKAYLHAFDARIIGLTGSTVAIDRIAREYHVYAARRPLSDGVYSVDHSNTLYLMGPDGKFAGVFDETIGPDALASALRKKIGD